MKAELTQQKGALTLVAQIAENGKGDEIDVSVAQYDLLD